MLADNSQTPMHLKRALKFALLLIVFCLASCTPKSSLLSELKSSYALPQEEKAPFLKSVKELQQKQLPLKVLYRVEVSTPISSDVFRKVLVIESFANFRLDIFATSFSNLVALATWRDSEFTLTIPQEKTAYKGSAGALDIANLFRLPLTPDELAAWSIGTTALQSASSSSIKISRRDVSSTRFYQSGLSGFLIHEKKGRGVCVISRFNEIRLIEHEIFDCDSEELLATTKYIWEPDLEKPKNNLAYTIPLEITLNLESPGSAQIKLIREQAVVGQKNTDEIEKHISFSPPARYKVYPLQYLREAQGASLW